MRHARKHLLACSSSWLVLTPLVASAALGLGVSAASAQAAQPSQVQTLTATDSASAAGAGASDTGAADSTVGEITVTARLREENVQTVPEQVAVVTPKVLQDNNITNFYNLQGFAPSVDVYTGWVKDYTTVEIRGFSAAAYMNEVPSQPYSLYDLSNVQILYGPQGTLFGYTALGGAVLYTSTHPEMNHFGAGIDLTLGNLNMTNVQGYVNIPLVEDRLAMRIAFERDHTDGYTRIQGSSVKLDSNDNESVRFGLEYHSSGGRFTNYSVLQLTHEFDTETAEVPTFANTLGEYWQQPATTPTGIKNLGPTPTTAFGSYYLCSDYDLATYWAPGTTAAQCAAQHVGVLNTFTQQALAGVALARASHYREVPAPMENAPVLDLADDDQIENITNYDVGRWTGALGGGDIYLHNIAFFGWYHNLVSNFTVGAFDYYAASGTLDVIPTPPTSLLVPGQNTNPTNGFGAPSLGGWNTYYSDEFQIHGTLDTALGDTPGVSWVVGFYNYAGGNRTGPTSPNVPISFDGAYNANEGPYPSYWPKSYWTTHFGQYVNATVDSGMLWKPLTGLQFTGGLRLSENYANDKYYSIGTNPALPNQFFPTPPVSTTISQNQPLNWSWSVSYVTDKNLVYFNSAYIVVPGFANAVPLVPISEVPGYVPNAAQEELTDYDFGDKYHFDTGQVRGYLDVDAYHEELNHVQIGETVFVPQVGTYVTYTANPANEIKEGLEFQGEIFPIPNLDIYANISYAHDRYTTYLAPDPTSYFQATNGWVGTYSIAPGAVNSPLCVPSASRKTVPTGLTTGTCIMDFKSSPLPFSPNVQASLRINYTIPLQDNWGDLVANMTANYTSEEYMAGGYTNIPLLREEQLLGPGVKAAESSPAHTLLNLRLTWEHPLGNEHLTAALWMTNVTNATYATGSLDFLFATGVATQDFDAPREFGLQVTAKW